MIFKKRWEETQTLRAGCSIKGKPKIFALLQTTSPRMRGGQNLVIWRWSLPLPTTQFGGETEKVCDRTCNKTTRLSYCLTTKQYFCLYIRAQARVLICAWVLFRRQGIKCRAFLISLNCGGRRKVPNCWTRKSSSSRVHFVVKPDRFHCAIKQLLTHSLTATVWHNCGTVCTQLRRN